MITEKFEQSVIDEHRDKWLSKLFNYELVDFDANEAVRLGKAIYSFCNLEEPEVFVLDSPGACQQKAKELCGGDKDYPYSSYGNYSDFGWVAFYDFFIDKIEIEEKLKQNFFLVRDFIQHCFTSIQLEKHLFISRYPTEIIRDENLTLHSTEGPALFFKDGYSCHYIRGMFVPSDMYQKVVDKSVTFEEIINLPNEEHKSAVFRCAEEIHGSEYMYSIISEVMEEVDSYVDKKDEKFMEGTTGGMNVGVYTLFKGKIDDNELAYVRCYCPSSDRMFMLGVESEFTTAKDAIASLYRVPRKLVGHIKEIRRQGERFTTSFTEEGLEVKNKMTQEDISDLVGINGDAYFKLMTYEY